MQTVYPHSQMIRFAVIAALAMFVTTRDAWAAESPAAAPAPSPTPTTNSPAGSEDCAAFASPFPTWVFYPQPNLRRATRRYEATFVVSPEDARLIALLDKPLPDGGLPAMKATPVREVSAIVEKLCHVPVQLDIAALEEADLDADTPITFPAIKDSSLGNALFSMLADSELAFTVRHQMLVITTEDKASDHRIVGVYPVSPRGNFQPLIDLIQSTVCAESWDTVGGPGAVRPFDETSSIVVSQSVRVHLEILDLMRSMVDADLTPRPGQAPGEVPIRVYHLRNPKLTNTFVTELAGLCNAALGEAADPNAKVSLIGENRLVIQSASRPFQVYAGELIASLDGIAR